MSENVREATMRNTCSLLPIPYHCTTKKKMKQIDRKEEEGGGGGKKEPKASKLIIEEVFLT